MRRALWWIGGLVAGLIIVVALAFAVADEPLRAYLERQLNHRVQGYSFRIGKLDLRPLDLGIELEDLALVQDRHPDPPVAHIAKWSAGLYWRQLLTGQLVSDHRIERPVLHLTRPQTKAELEDEAPAEQKGWQEAVLAVYPIQINKLTISDGEFFYRDHPDVQPLRATQVNLEATNIRNVRSPTGEYPSELHVDGLLFDEGRVRVDGRADFLAQPHPAVALDVSLERVPLKDLVALLGRYHLQLRDGTATIAGRVDYAPSKTAVELTQAHLTGVRLDYVYSADGRNQQQRRAGKAAARAQQSANRPDLLLKIHQATIENSEFGFVNTATSPEYRVFLNGTDVYLENVSNHLSEGPAVIRLRGMLMGNGPTTARATLRPEVRSPDFDLFIQITNTRMESLNKLFRAYGQFDVADGAFSFFSELKVKDGRVDGYLKPLFKDVDVYDPQQDRDKGLIRKAYEGVVGGLANLLSNEPRDEVATKAEVSGPVQDPRASTWEVLVNLLRNAFFRAILPGLERAAPG
ncbi:DUF748 domain-containing protein [Candidatus Nitrospira bockiana]